MYSMVFLPLILAKTPISVNSCHGSKAGVSKVTIDDTLYDLTELTKHQLISTDSDPTGLIYTYKLQMCGLSTSKCPDGDLELTSGAMMQVYTNLDGESECCVIAQWDKTGQWKKIENGIQVVYHNGGDCGFGTPRRAVLNYICDPSMTEKDTQNNWAVTNNYCTYTATIKTKYACGSAVAGLSWGGVFIIAFLSTFVVYFLVGFIYNVRVEKTGCSKESIPHREFWISFPSLAADGFNYVKYLICKYINCSKDTPHGIPNECDSCSPDVDIYSVDYGTGNLGSNLLHKKKQKKNVCSDEI